MRIPRGTQAGLVEAAIEALPGELTLYDLKRAWPGVSRNMVCRVLRNFQKGAKVVC